MATNMSGQLTVQPYSKTLDLLANSNQYSGALNITGAATLDSTLQVTGLITPSAGISTVVVPKTGLITLGSNASVSGSGYALTASLTAAMKVYADDGGVLYGAAAVRTAVFRNLITLSHSNETSIFGSQSQLKIKPVLDTVLTTGNRAGSWNYLEMAGTATKTITLSGANKITGGSFSMVEWDGVGSLTLSANHVLSAYGALTNVVKGAGTFTQTGIFAGFSTVNNAAASYSPFDVGIYLGYDSVRTILNAGSASTPIVSDTADTKFLQIYTDCGASSGDNRSIYNRLYLTSTGGGESLRTYTDVSGTVGTAHGMHCSLGFGESTTTGAVTALGVAGRFTLGLADIAYPATGTLGVIEAEIYSFGASSDPAGNQIAMIRLGNNGNASGQADVDDDAVAIAFDGWTSADGNMLVKAGTPGAMGNATWSVRCMMPDGSLAYLNFTAAPVTA